MKIHPLITTSAALADLCERLSTADFICVDTEFMRENTYWPELCLIQIADTEEAAAIDPMAAGIDLAPLLKLLLKIRAREIDVAARLLARSDDLELLAAGVRKNLSLLEGWRYEQFGREAVEMVEGKLAFAVLGGKLKMTHIDAIHQQMGEQNAAAIADGAEDVEASEDGAE